MDENKDNDLIFDEERMQLEEQNRQRRRERAEIARRKEQKRKNDQWYHDMMNYAHYQSSYTPNYFCDPPEDPISLVQWVRDLRTISNRKSSQIITIPEIETKPYLAILEASVPASTHRHYHTEFTVNTHIRNLSKGRRASPEKRITASEYGIELKEGQTWVREHVKGAEKNQK